jgi:hypothetical protein
MGEFIFFVPPKKTNQKKSGPVVGRTNGATPRHPKPVGAAEHRRNFEIKRASLSSWIC